MAKTADKPTRRKQALDAIDFTSDREMLTSQQATDEAPAITPPAPAPEPPQPAIQAEVLSPEFLEKTADVKAGDVFILLNVRGCSACGGDHDGVILIPLPSPAIDITHTHFFNCPTTAERITIQHLGV